MFGASKRLASHQALAEFRGSCFVFCKSRQPAEGVSQERNVHVNRVSSANILKDEKLK
jgi:hypothetical protein